MHLLGHIGTTVVIQGDMSEKSDKAVDSGNSQFEANSSKDGRFGVFQALYASVYSKELYLDVIKRWRGYGFRYLLVLVLVSTVCVTWQITSEMYQLRDRYLDGFLAQIPKIEIANGVVTSEVSQPYTIKNPESGKDLAILDTTGKVDSLADTDAVLLLTKDKVYLRREGGGIQTENLSEVETFRIDAQSVESWVSTMSWLAPWIFGLVVFGMTYVYRFFVLIIFSLIGILIVRVVGLNWNFPLICRVTAVALTPVILLNLLLIVVLDKSALIPIFELVLTLGYVYFAARSFKDTLPVNT